MRTIPIALQAHKAQATTSLCYLIRIGPLRDGTMFGMTSLDRDVTYDDGDGELVYYAKTGHQHSNLASQNDLSVDNGEGETLLASQEEISTYPAPGVTQEMIDARMLDGVEFVIYQVNWKDLTQGHQIQASGPIGEVKTRVGGLVTLELRSWSQYLQQNSVVQLDSLTCRARFGSQYGDPGIDGIFPCTYNAEAEWIEDVEVTAVGSETVREFTAASLGQATDYFKPGLWHWTEGANRGTFQEIESFTAGGGIVLRFTTLRPIEAGDRGNIRRNCTNEWEGPNSCQTFNNRPFFRGEPKMRLSNTIALTVPFAANQ